MSTEQNKPIVHQFADRINARDLDGAITHFSPHHLEHAVMPGMPSGAEAVRTFFSMLFAGFPDVQTTILDTIAEGDKVVVRASKREPTPGRFWAFRPPANTRSGRSSTSIESKVEKYRALG